jgi:hypothetical protein
MPGPTLFELARSLDNELKGNFRYPSKTVVAAGITVLNGNFDAVVDSDASAGAQNIQLPDATKNAGMPFFLKKVDASGNPVVISCAVGGQLIDGAASFTLGTQNDFLIVFSNGTGYKIYSKLVTPVGPGASVYTVKKIYKTDGVHTLNPVDGTLINFNVAADGECFFAATGIFGGLTSLASVDLAIYVDGVLLVHSDTFYINGAGGDRSGPVTQEPNGSIFLTAGAHSVQLVAGQVNLALQASAADPLTLTVLFPGSVSTGTLLSPEAARVRTSAPVTINPAAVISFGVVDAVEGNLFNPVTPTKMIAQLGGWYIFEAQLLTDVGIDGSFRSLKLRKNGVTIIAFDQRDDFVHNNTQRGLRAQSGPILLNPGDFIEVIAETDATDTGNSAVAASDYSIIFAGARMIPGSASGDKSARVSISAATVPIPNNTPTPLSFDLVDYDTDSFFNLGSPTKLTIPVDGKYDIFIGPILWDAGTGTRLLIISKNGGPSVAISSIAAAPGTSLTAHEASARGVSCITGDFFEVSVLQDSGAPININTDSGLGDVPVFYAKKVN